MTPQSSDQQNLFSVGSRERLSVAGLFAGIGGIEAGLMRAGHKPTFLCEWDPAARRVLDERFSGVSQHADVQTLDGLPSVDLVAAGFPCQDLSQAGRTAGIRGKRSGLVERVFELLENADHDVRWLLLENVPFMLVLDSGAAMQWLTQRLDDAGYTWAYRVVDSRAFGLPQRRQRVLMLASRTADPRPVLFGVDAGEPPQPTRTDLACGFYWTEGNRGLGWAVDAIPTLKGGSSLGIPSAPAIWHPGSERIVTPDIEAAERLQGFSAGWTAHADDKSERRSHRWKLVGNAVSVPVAEWLGTRLGVTHGHDPAKDSPFRSGMRWPRAAWGRRGERFSVDMSMWPIHMSRPHLHDYIDLDCQPSLSIRATSGFLRRLRASTLRYREAMFAEAEAHVARMSEAALAAV